MTKLLFQLLLCRTGGSPLEGSLGPNTRFVKPFREKQFIRYVLTSQDDNPSAKRSHSDKGPYHLITYLRIKRITLIFHFLAEVVPTVTIRTRGSVELPGPASIYLRAVSTKWRILNIVKNVNVCKEDEQWIWFGWYFRFKPVLTCASLCSHHIQGWLCFRWNIYVQILLFYIPMLKRFSKMVFILE